MSDVEVNTYIIILNITDGLTLVGAQYKNTATSRKLCNVSLQNLPRLYAKFLWIKLTIFFTKFYLIRQNY